MIEVKNISFSYKNKKNILSDISFTLDEGESLCLLGPNGTGKSTLLKCLLGLNKIKSGNIFIDNKNANSLSTKQHASMMAYVSQSSSLTFPYKVHEVVTMGRTSHIGYGSSVSKKDIAIVNECLDKLDISHMTNLYFNELSGGERQMVLIARALAQQSKFLIMDEPTSNLDYSNQIKILKVIKSLSDEGYAILMTSHFPDHAFLASNKVALMREGRIMAQGSPESVVTSQNLTKLYESPVCVTEANTDTFGIKSKVCIPIMK